MIINIEPHNFGGPVRNGDIIAVLNFYTWLAEQPPHYNNIKFHIPDRSIHQSDYIIRFRNWLNDNVSLLSPEPGEGTLNMQGVNLWDLRSLTGDKLILDFNKPIKKKIVIAPLFDGAYNQYRNWPVPMFESIIQHYSKDEYKDYEKIICVKNDIVSTFYDGWKNSYDFIENIEHIVDCSHYVGGDTGTSHFASVLPNKEKLNYYYGSVGLLHTTPFYALQGKGNINMFHNNNWRLDLL